MKSEHCIGFLKGWFTSNSLHGLCIQINNQHNLVFASLWIVACIVVHNFALKGECSSGTDFDSDTFFAEGVQIIREEQDSQWKQDREHQGNLQEIIGREEALICGKAKCEVLKNLLFEDLHL